MASKQVLFLAAAAIAVLSLAPQASGEVFTVGDSAGWTLKYPSSWTDGKNFTVGDSLTFTYAAGKHTVVEVTGAGFKACDTTGNQMLGSWSSGSDTVKLDKAGRRWFVCGVGNHCEQGMKLLVITADSKASSASLNYNAGAGAAALVAGAAAAPVICMTVRRYVNGRVVVGSRHCTTSLLLDLGRGLPRATWFFSIY